MKDGFYTPFGIIFEITGSVVYVYNHKGNRVKYLKGFNKNQDQAYDYIKRKPNMIYKNTEPNTNIALKLSHHKSNTVWRKTA